MKRELWIMMWCLLLAGCAEEKLTAPADAPTTPVKVEVRVDSIADYTDDELPATRALSEGMRFRISVVDALDNKGVTYADYKYTAADGVVPIDGGGGLLLPGKGYYTFWAHSYNRADAITTGAWDWLEVRNGEDFMVCRLENVKVDKHMALNIRFKHLMSRVRVAVQAQQEIEQCTGKLMNVPASCYWRTHETVLTLRDEVTNVDLKFSGRGTTVVSDPVLLIPSGGVRTLQVDFPLIVTGGQRYTNTSGVFRGVNWLPGTDHLYELNVMETLGKTAANRANCYIVLPDKEYVLNAEYEGNGVDWDVATMTSNIKVGTTVPGTPAGAKLVWQSAPGLITDVKYQGGDILFKTNNVRTQFVGQEATGGNAVVAVTDAEGFILWSWHLWVVDSKTTKSAINTGAGDGNRYMDRNLGALGNTPESKVLAYGMLYQWGRKDPFPASSQFAAGTESTLYNTIGESEKIEIVSSGTMANAAQQPLLFMTDGADWLLSRNDYLWGHISNSQNIKTRYDPCPPGWKVPPLNAYSSASVATGPWSADSKGRTFAALGGWFPAAGDRWSIYGVFHDVGLYGYYWTSTVNTGYGSALHFGSDGIAPAYKNYRMNGYGLRCVSESEYK